MAIPYVSTHGSEDPTRSTFAWMQARAAVEIGHEATLTLIGDSVVTLREEVVEHVQGMGLPALKDAVQFVKDNNIKVFA